MANPDSNAPDENNKSASNIQLQDIEWLSSLSEPEIDFLISLKELAIKRARNTGCKDLGENFDLRMLRALGFVLLEFFKERFQTSFEIADSAEALKLLYASGLSTLNNDENSESNSPIKGTSNFSFIIPRRKRMWDGLREETPRCNKRQKTIDK